MHEPITVIVTSVAMLAAIGSPGVVWWVLRRMTAGHMDQQQAHCKECRAEIERRFDKQEDDEKQIVERQLILRQIDIPHIREHFAKKVDLDAATAEIKREIRESGAEMKVEFRSFREKVTHDITRLHTRIDNINK
jgi:hypothetical protein